LATLLRDVPALPGGRQAPKCGDHHLSETFSRLRGPLGEKGGAWEVGIQTGVFGLFDLDAPSTDLVDTDYLVGFPAYRARNVSAMARFFHQSSHLGDEFASTTASSGSIRAARP
jgi:Protein of unknown function (DUF1207)